MDGMRRLRSRSALCVFFLATIVSLCPLSQATTDITVDPGADAAPVAITKGFGFLWVVEANRNAIAKVNPVGGAITEYHIPGLNYTYSLYNSRIVSGPLGLVWFTDYYDSLIGSIDPQTGAINTYPATITYTVGSYSYTYPAYPFDLTVGPDGALWFTPYYSYLGIGRFDPVTHNSTTINPALNTCPSRIVTGSDQNLWYLDQCGHSVGANYVYDVVRITTVGVATVFPMPNSNNFLEDIASGPDGNLWVTDYNNHDIYRVTTAGAVTQFSLIQGALPNQVIGQPGEITGGPDGNLWFKENLSDPLNSYNGGAVGFITPQGALTQGLKNLENPKLNYNGGIVAGPDNLSVWTADGYYGSPSIADITVATRTISNTYAPAPGSHPTAITTGPDGNLWFLEPTANKIGMSTPTGTVASFLITTPGSRPQQIAPGPAGSGTIWFTELGPTDATGLDVPGTQRIARADTNTGQVLEFPIAADANCTPYGYGMAITLGPDNDLWVADGCGFIEKFKPNGASAPTETDYTIPNSGIASYITVGGDGNLWFLDWNFNKVYNITPAGTFGPGIATTPDFFYYYSDLTLGSDGNIWFAPFYGNNLYGFGQVTPSGVVTPFNLNNTSFQTNSTNPGLVTGADGSLWETSGSARMNAVNTQGQLELFADASNVSYSDILAGITNGPDHKLWVTENQSGRLGRLSAIAGTLTLSPAATNSGIPVSVQADFNDGTPTAQLSDLTATGTWTDSSSNVLSTFAVPIIANGGNSFSALVDPRSFPTADFYTLQLIIHDSVDNQDYTMQAVETIGSPSNTSLTVSPNPASAGSPVTFTAHVTSVGGIPSGTVDFCCDANGLDIGTAQLDNNGYAILSSSSLPVGQNFVSASYKGDRNFRPSNSTNFITLSVLQAN